MDAATTAIVSAVITAFVSIPGAFITAMAAGKLLPRKLVDELLAAERRRADDYKETLETERERNDEITAQFREVLEGVKLIEQLIRGIRDRVFHTNRET